MKSYIKDPTNENRDNGINIFYAISASNNLIMHAHFIGADGSEKISMISLCSQRY